VQTCDALVFGARQLPVLFGSGRVVRLAIVLVRPKKNQLAWNRLGLAAFAPSIM
jgi:hypothetical protein